MDDLVKEFYFEIINSKDFNGNYFDALLNAIAMSKVYSFIKHFINY